MWPGPGWAAATPGPRRHLVPVCGPGGFPCCSPHAAGLWVPGALALVLVAWSLPTRLSVPSCAVLIVSIATGGIQHRTAPLGELKQAKRGWFVGCSGVCRFHLFCSLLPAGVEDGPHLPHSPGKAARSPGLHLHSFLSEEDAERSSSLLLLWLPPQCPHPREGRGGEGGGERLGGLCAGASLHQLAAAERRAGRVRLHRAHPCPSSDGMPLPCPWEWSFLHRQWRRC